MTLYFFTTLCDSTIISIQFLIKKCKPGKFYFVCFTTILKNEMCFIPLRWAETVKFNNIQLDKDVTKKEILKRW